MRAPRRPASAWRLLPVLFVATALSGCNTLQQFGGLGPQIVFGLIESTLLDAFVTPTVVANAGPARAILTNERIVLDGRGSSLQTGSGSGAALPDGANFQWAIVSSPLLDAAGNPIIDPALLAAAGIQLDAAASPTCQFVSAVGGDFVIQLTVTATSNGRVISGSDVTGINVSTPVP